MADPVNKLGKYGIKFRDVLRWQGRAADGKDAAVIDFTSGTWATTNQYAIITAEVASDVQNTPALRTQSHSSGHFIDGSVKFDVYMETPALWTDDQAKFQRDLLHHLRGQLGAPVRLHLTAALTQPTIDGVNGENADVTGTATDWMLPYGMVYPGGV